uniref:Proliferating cell nuclear antigen PCNA N-terminal domain-containing protein n=1 Tax=Ignisphaera aggregans TaxID=334771 RepID=A0A7C2Z1E0_9CREN
MSTVIPLTIEPKVLFAYPSARDFTKILKVLSEMVDETALLVDDGGVHVKALDPGRIAMLIVNLPPEAFQEFKVDESLSIGLAVSNLVKVLKNLKKGDRIVIAANEEYNRNSSRGSIRCAKI